MNIQARIDILANLRGVDYRVHDGPAGRIIDKLEGEDEEKIPAASEQRYDVVTIGGYSLVVAGGAGPDESINEFYGEENHIFGVGLTRQQVDAGNWTWGRGVGTMDAGITGVTFFALAAIPAGTRKQIPVYTAEWFNEILPANMLAARSCVGLRVHDGVLAICQDRAEWVNQGAYNLNPLVATLTLKIGVIGPRVIDPW